MYKRAILEMASVVAICMVCAPRVSCARDRMSLKGTKPNIVLIMPDDISYGSIGAYGGAKPSPNVDALYRKGLRFEDFHVSPTCSPARASLLTGRHECYSGVTHTIVLRDRLSLKSRTVADMLRDSGYATGIFGKWHLGDGEEYRPDRRGFDEVYIHGAGGIAQNYSHSADFPNNDYNDPVLYHNGNVIETKGFCTDLFFDQAIRWIKGMQGKGKPFFCYIPPNVNHGPHIPPILPDGTKGDSMINLDDNVGKMMKFLDDSGLSEKTLLIYMTDNGANSGNKRLRGGKGSPYEGGTRVPCIMYWKDRIEGGVDCDRLTGHIDFYPTFAELAGSTDPVPGDREWDGRSILSLMENPKADWGPRYWITHKTRWRSAASAKYSACSIRDSRYKLVMPKAGVSELYDLSQDQSEKKNIIRSHPDTARGLKTAYDSWWDDIQPYLVNDRLTDAPKTHKPYHELYRKAFGQERFDEAMRKMTWTGGKPYGSRKKRKKRK
jgi:arylsulfatase